MPLVGVRYKVRELRMLNPHWSLGDLAKEVGVSRERVRQLLVAEGLDTRRKTPKRIFADALAGVQEIPARVTLTVAEPQNPSLSQMALQTEDERSIAELLNGD